jgi:hypothetical protein
MKTKKVASITDPTQRAAKLTLDGEIYKMVFTFAALAEAEDRLVASDPEVNLLFNLPRLRMRSTRVLFAASMMTHHPKIAFEDAENLVTRENSLAVMTAIVEAWNLSMPETKAKPDEDTQDPSQPDS